MITTIFFDIGNVLVGFDHHLIWQRLAQYSTFTADDLARRVQAAGLMDLHETGKLGPTEFFERVQACGHLSAALSFEEFCRLWADIFWEQTPVIELASQLRRRYQVWLLSNTGEIHWVWLLQRFPIFSQVYDQILSFQVGAMKPAPAIYQAALRRAQAAPDHCVYIDDIPDYAAASRAHGIHGIHYQSPEHLSQALHRLGITISAPPV